MVVEYALRNVDTPIGVARYQLLPPETLPEGLADALPTQDELEPGMLPPDASEAKAAVDEAEALRRQLVGRAQMQAAAA